MGRSDHGRGQLSFGQGPVVLVENDVVHVNRAKIDLDLELDGVGGPAEDLEELVGNRLAAEGRPDRYLARTADQEKPAVLGAQPKVPESFPASSLPTNI
jgi:hypothetical protein